MAAENDIVLVHLEDQPLFFARIEAIQADAKPDWYHVKLLVLQVPLQSVSWILRNAYINGGEFTMGGKRMRLERVEAPTEDRVPATDPSAPAHKVPKPDRKAGPTRARVISLSDLKKK
jgi:hypothetical protein